MIDDINGAGVNDAPPEWERDGCPFYPVWEDMLENEEPPVTVCKEWKSFWTFKQWMEKQDWEGKYLNYQILIPGNKECAPDACIFVTEEINNIVFCDPKDWTGELPEGVSLV